ncbi:MAG: hypothetical protein ACR2NL_12365, partial [Acidimicrobiia bacterium]
MRRILVAAIAVALLGALVLPSATFAAEPAKVEICHLSDDGEFMLISVAEPAVDAHLANHGDGLPNSDYSDLGYGPCADSDGDGTLDSNESDICVSINGVEVLHHGEAECDSVTPDPPGGAANIAIAQGVDSTALATAPGSGNTATAFGADARSNAGNMFGNDHTATAVGARSLAVAADGNGNTATATGDDAEAIAGAGHGNTAIASGNFAHAEAESGDGNTAT